MTTDPLNTTNMRRVAVLVAAALVGVVTAVGLVAVVIVGGSVAGSGERFDAGSVRPPEGGPGPDRARTATTDSAALSDGYRVWARNDDGRPVRWDPCGVIELVVDDTGAPDGFDADLRAAMADVEDASGLEFRITNRTDERPAAGRSAYQPTRYGERWAPVLVAWADPLERGLPLHAFDRGVAMPVAVGSEGDQTYVTGQVVFNRARTDLQPGDADRASSWGATILHELVHLVGLAHVDDPVQLMDADPGSGAVELGPGDAAGLRAVGAGDACRPAPTPGPVELVERS